MTRWASDTCNCDIEFDDNTLKIMKIIQKCKSHNPKIGQSFIGSDSQTHNKNINIQGMEGIIDKFNPTKRELEILSNLKKVEFLD